ncbi:protein-serine/threonine phosphatase [Ranunculus cassubicifolius]
MVKILQGELQQQQLVYAGEGLPVTGVSGNMLQFYTDDAPGLKISPNVVLVMSIGFIAFVAVMHVVGNLYLVPT